MPRHHCAYVAQPSAGPFRGHNIDTLGFTQTSSAPLSFSTKAMTASTAYRSAIANGIDPLRRPWNQQNQCGVNRHKHDHRDPDQRRRLNFHLIAIAIPSMATLHSTGRADAIMHLSYCCGVSLEQALLAFNVGLRMNLPTRTRIQRAIQKSAESAPAIARAGTHFVVQGTNKINRTCRAARMAIVTQNHACRLSFHFTAMTKPSTKTLFSVGNARANRSE